MISWVGLQQPGLSWAWETDVGASALPPGPMESSEAAEKCSVCPVCVCIGRNAFISVLYHISFVLITILAGSRHIEGVLTYAHNLLFGYMLILLHCVLMYKSFLLLCNTRYHILSLL